MRFVGALKRVPEPGTSSRAIVGMSKKRPARVELREIRDVEQLVVLLRLRHRIYFEQEQYGAIKPLRLDLTAHDSRSRLIGVYQDGVLVGGSRVVLRSEQSLASSFRALRNVADLAPEPETRQLPSEEAFDLAAAIGADAQLVDAEVGRLTLDARVVSPVLGSRMVLATLAHAYAGGARMYLYSCARILAKRYARLTNPRHIVETKLQGGFASDNFVFPKPTIAAVAAVEDSPYARLILEYARQVRERGFIDMLEDHPELHYSRAVLRQDEPPLASQLEPLTEHRRMRGKPSAESDDGGS